MLVAGTDRIAVTRQLSITLASQAYRGEAGDGSFLVDDEAAALTFPSLKVVEMTEDASGGEKFLYRGRVMSKALDGEPYVTGNSRMYAISTSELRRRPGAALSTNPDQDERSSLSVDPSCEIP